MVWKKTPEVATFRKFHDIDVFNKKNHPIQYFFKETIPGWFSYKKFYLNEKYWEFKHKYLPWRNYSKCPTGLDPKQYYDIPELMIHVNFKFLERYIEKEKCFENIVWDIDCDRKFVASELEDLYFWWKNIRSKRNLTEEELYGKVSNHFVGEATEEDKKIYDKLNKLEIFWHEEDNYNLKRLINIRSYMWS